MWGLLLTSVLLLGQATLASPAGRCTCKDPHRAAGWCRVHEVGYVGDVRIRSAWLFDAVDPYGHDVDLTARIRRRADDQRPAQPAIDHQPGGEKRK